MAVRLFVSYAFVNKSGVLFFANAEVEENNEPSSYEDIKNIENDIMAANDYIEFVSIQNWKVLGYVAGANANIFQPAGLKV